MYGVIFNILTYNITSHIDALRSVKDRANEFRNEHPNLVKAGGIALMVGGGIVIVPAVEAALLLAAGFGPLGPIAGKCFGQGWWNLL